MPTKPTVTFRGYRCNVKLSRYANGQPYLSLRLSDGCPVATASVSVPEISLQPGQILIKDYSENEGILAVLESAQIVKSIAEIPCGYTHVNLCELLIPAR